MTVALTAAAAPAAPGSSGVATGSGDLVLATSPTIASPTLTTPNIGAATGTSLATTGMNTGTYGGATTRVNHVGTQTSNGAGVAIAAGQTFTFTCESGKLVVVSLDTGKACVFFASYASAAITMISNPDGTGVFDATSTPGANVLGIFKNSNTHVVQIKNGSGGSSKTIQLCVLGSEVTAATAPA